MLLRGPGGRHGEQADAQGAGPEGFGGLTGADQPPHGHTGQRLHGYAIATGIIEGACRHVVKDRLEHSGMRWTLEGAQAMLHVRSVLASSHREDFQEQRMQQEQKEIHPDAQLARSHSSPPVKV